MDSKPIKRTGISIKVLRAKLGEEIKTYKNSNVLLHDYNIISSNFSKRKRNKLADSAFRVALLKKRSYTLPQDIVHASFILNNDTLKRTVVKYVKKFPHRNIDLPYLLKKDDKLRVNNIKFRHYNDTFRYLKEYRILNNFKKKSKKNFTKYDSRVWNFLSKAFPSRFEINRKNKRYQILHKRFPNTYPGKSLYKEKAKVEKAADKIFKESNADLNDSIPSASTGASQFTE